MICIYIYMHTCTTDIHTTDNYIYIPLWRPRGHVAETVRRTGHASNIRRDASAQSGYALLTAVLSLREIIHPSLSLSLSL